MLQNYCNIFIFGLTILQTKSLFLTLSLSLSLSLFRAHTQRSPFDPDNLATVNPRIMSNALNLKLQK